jgi:hypothetical protein
MELSTATKDAINMANLLQNMQSGIHTYQLVFNALEKEYQPFLNAKFRKYFYRGLSK